MKSSDAMEKLTDRYDVNLPGRPLLCDAMDQIVGISDLLIPTPPELNVETGQDTCELDTLGVETDPEKCEHTQKYDNDAYSSALHVETF